MGASAFHLKLMDGSRWRLIGEAGLEPWVDRLAAAMGLGSADGKSGSPLLFRKAAETGPWKYAEPLESAGHPPRILALENVCIRHTGADGQAVCEVRLRTDPVQDIVSMWVSLEPILGESIRRGGLPLHGGLVERGQGAVILAAPGDGGKSTACRRIRAPWRPVCDDETLVVVDSVGGYHAHPLPTWSDYMFRRSEKTWDVQGAALPLNAVFFLGWADRDRARPLGAGAAAVQLYGSAWEVCRKFWHSLPPSALRRRRRRLFDNACALAARMPAYTLHLRADGRFWREMERVLAENGPRAEETNATAAH